MSEIVELTTTVETEAQAQTLAEQLVNARLAGCVQITGPICSVYRWQGNVERAQEFRCTIKTLADMVDSVVAAVERMHPYDVPEILLVQVARCSAAYADWLRGQVGVDEV